LTTSGLDVVDFEDIIEYEIEDDPMVYAEFVTMVLCKLCGKITKDSDTFRQHFVIHLNVTTAITKSVELFKYQCSVCAQQFNNKKPLREHMKIHCDRIKNVESTTAELQITGKRVRKLRKDPNCVNPDDILEPEDQILEIESKQKQNEYRKPMPLKVLKAKLKKRFIHKCTLKGCFYKFKTTDNRDQHLKAHASSDVDKVREFRCSECSEEFKKWRNCSNHYWRQHKIDLDMLKCPLCDYKSSLSSKW
jgi:DNA-directed RNA polymerase subunit RPC12/RpoP